MDKIAPDPNETNKLDAVMAATRSGDSVRFAVIKMSERRYVVARRSVVICGRTNDEMLPLVKYTVVSKLLKFEVADKLYWHLAFGHHAGLDIEPLVTDNYWN